MLRTAIVLSGLPGAGKNELARKLSERYNWKIFSIGDLWREKWHTLYPNSEVSFEEYWKTLSKNEQAGVNEEARSIVENGKVIGDFRYAVCCQGLPALFVFLTADLEIRAKRALESGKYKDLTLEEVKILLSQREKEELKWGKTLYGESYDYRVARQYDLIINTGRLTPQEEIELIDKKLKQ